MFLVDITIHLNELNLCLQGPGKTVIGLFEAWKSFVSGLAVYTRDIQTANFRYFKHLKAFSVDHQVNGVEINIYMRDLTSQFRNRFQDFQRFTKEVHCFLFSSIPMAAKIWTYLHLNG